MNIPTAQQARETVKKGEFHAAIKQEQEIAELINQAISIGDTKRGAELKWNSEADAYNQWNSLGQDEKDQLISEFVEIIRNIN